MKFYRIFDNIGYRGCYNNRLLDDLEPEICLSCQQYPCNILLIALNNSHKTMIDFVKVPNQQF